MSSGKEHIGRMAEIMARKGVEHAVVSPGSRNAPVIILFARNGKLRLTSIADERSAGFFALGMAQKLGKPVAVVCTSGSAAVNYGPAISEAFYQKIPLIVITADRPAAWVDQGDGQTIRQEGLFKNFIRKSYQLPEKLISGEDEWHFDRLVNEAVDYARFPAAGPVHLNLPLAEPLYDLEHTNASPEVRITHVAPVICRLQDDALLELARVWNGSGQKMILAGQMAPDNRLDSLVSRLANDPSVVILTETTSNICGEGYVECIDRVIEGMDPGEPEFRPEILLTFGGAVVSKKIKTLLRKMRPSFHWHINPDTTEFHLDTYQSLTLTIASAPDVFLNEFLSLVRPVESNFRAVWNKRNIMRRDRHIDFLRNTDYCDLKVYEYLFDTIPEGTHIHLANSTPVRYAQLFELRKRFRFWSNRGTSGIDGSVSTAAGHAFVSGELTVLITGDIGFFYDSNALWNSSLSPNFKIILINNGGGNIFRILPGPSRFNELEPYLETAHSYRAEGIASSFGLAYYQADNPEALQSRLTEFFSQNEKPSLLEIITPAAHSAGAVSNYFKYMIQ
jgi:2-succinyl-5-enolpyruvyl-6-hydroxy-3-cyclohexene-1-carboxylate synthase